MSIANHTKLLKLNFPKRDRKYLLEITIGHCESHLLYMLILNPLRHSCQRANQDVAPIFIDTLEKNIKDILKKFQFPNSMIMTMHDKLVDDNSNLCHICNEDVDEGRVRDHCHMSGKYRGAAHEVCNLRYKVPQFSQ